jgi:cytoskeleton protein RodZ
MFEIGSSLQEARSRRRLELSQVERETRIRSRYLLALEDERFDVLPAPAYTRGFLRTYAEYLGLDGQRFVDEYNTRFAPAEEPVAAPPTPIRRRRLTRQRQLLLVLPVAAVLALVAWQLAGAGGEHPAAHAPPPPSTQAKKPAAAPAQHPVKRTPRPARIEVRATRGPCWLSVHLGSANGKLLYEQTLEEDGIARFVGRRLWIRFGAPWNLEASLNGSPLRLPDTTGNVVVTAAGLANAA